jgi:methionyl-tRNA formyltransferase
MHGDPETGVTIMRVVKALDAGPMLEVVRLPIGPEVSSAEVEAGLAVIGAEALLTTVDRLASGTAVETAQDEAGATYAPRLTRDDGLVDWGRPALAVHDQVRGLHPWPHAFTYLEGQRLILHRARVSPAAPVTAPPGAIQVTRDTLGVVCGDGRVLELLAVQPEGKRVLAPREYLAGRRPAPGARFGSA